MHRRFFFARVARIARKQQAKLIVDTSGEPLVHALEEGVFLAKPNQAELHYLTGKSPTTIDETMKAGMEVLHKFPCEALLISMGAGGAMLLRRDFYLHACAPATKRLSTCGAGDSMVAGATFMLERGKSWADVLHFGIACGTAATMNPGTHLFRKEDVYNLLKQMEEKHAAQP
nr:PfkB family carbohydrate kinase [Chitinophaga sedimenti]